MWAAHVGPTKQPTNDPVSTQFQHNESPLKKRDKTHMSPMWEQCSVHTWASPIGTYVKLVGERSWAHVGPTKQPTNDPVNTQFQHTESPLKKGIKHT